MINFIKNLTKFLLFKRGRKILLEEFKSLQSQKKLIPFLNRGAKKLTIFFVPGRNPLTGDDDINGGIISIVSLFEESVKLCNGADEEVVLCTFPGHGRLHKFQKFENSANVFHFQQIVQHFENVENLILHVPELFLLDLKESLELDQRNWIKHTKSHLNALNQSVMLMPNPMDFKDATSGYDFTTITTAHEKYCTQEFADLYNVPVHRFSVWITPENYKHLSFVEKEDLIIVSPDPHPRKNQILEILADFDLKVVIIQNLSYREYKDIISRAKWALTFGEGFDGYFIESIFSGAVSIAVYNEAFFPPEFEGVSSVFVDYESLEEDLINFLKDHASVQSFEKLQATLHTFCSKYYSFEQYRANLKMFYSGAYTFLPKTV